MRAVVLEFGLDSAAWTGITDRLTTPDESDDAFHRWVVDYWGGCEHRATTYLVRAHGGIATNREE